MILRDLPRRIGYAAHVLRGRPLAYRLHVGGDVRMDPRLVVAETTIAGRALDPERVERPRHPQVPSADFIRRLRDMGASEDLIRRIEA